MKTHYFFRANFQEFFFMKENLIFQKEILERVNMSLNSNKNTVSGGESNWSKLSKKVHLKKIKINEEQNFRVQILNQTACRNNPVTMSWGLYECVCMCVCDRETSKQDPKTAKEKRGR